MVFGPSGAKSTCESLRNLAMQAQSLSHLGITEVCDMMNGCRGIQCTQQVSHGQQMYNRFELLPCQRPAIHFISVYNGQVILDDVIDQSKVFDCMVHSLGLVAQINVTFVGRNNSVLMGVSDSLS